VRNLAIAITLAWLVAACGSGANTASRNRCQARHGVGTCVVRDGVYVPRGLARDRSTTSMVPPEDESFTILGKSMSPTLTNGEVVMGRAINSFERIERGAIIVFAAPAGFEPRGKDLVKRVVGLPGETIEGREGFVYINETKLSEPYLSKGTLTTPGFARRTLPRGCYWVMGDNRSVSEDSRYFGCIPRTRIIGTVEQP
jgi:signal peptidase I